MELVFLFLEFGGDNVTKFFVVKKHWTASGQLL